MLSILKLLLLRDSGSLEILQYKHTQKTTNISYTYTETKVKHQEKNTKITTNPKPVSIRLWNRCKYPAVTLNTEASSLFYFTIQLMKTRTNSERMDGAYVCGMDAIHNPTSRLGTGAETMWVCYHNFKVQRWLHDVSRLSETNVNVQITASLCCVGMCVCVCCDSWHPNKLNPLHSSDSRSDLRQAH